MSTPMAYAPAEAAQMLGVSRAMLYRLMDKGDLPSFRIGRARRIRHDDLVAMVDRLRDAAVR